MFKYIIIVLLIGCSAQESEIIGTVQHENIISCTEGFDVGECIPNMQLKDSSDNTVYLYDKQNLDLDYLIVDYSFIQ